MDNKATMNVQPVFEQKENTVNARSVPSKKRVEDSLYDAQKMLDLTRVPEGKLRTILRAADDKVAQNLRLIDLRSAGAFTDYFVIATGNNRNHTQAIADAVVDALAKEGFKVSHVEGFRDGGWILVDCDEVVLHIFTRDQRQFYDLEGLWG